MPPRPRPRPRPYPQPTPSSPADSSALTSRVHLEPSKEKEDDDALFMRNRGRSLKEVNKRAALAAATAPQTSSPTGSEEEEDEDEEDTPKLGRTRKQNTLGKSNALPKWTKKGVILNLLGDSDSESENNHPSAYDGTPSKRRRPGPASNLGTPAGGHSKRTRSRSRSLSLTPPPDLTLAQKTYAQQAINNALRRENMFTSSTPVVVIEDDDDRDDVGAAELDPALQHIAQAVLERAARQKGRGTDFEGAQAESSRWLQDGSSSKPPDVGVRVKWVPHPQDQLMRVRTQQTWSFIVKRHHSLKELHMQISNKAHVLPEDLVLMRDGKRVFTSVSPDGLGGWDQVDLEACDCNTFEALRARHFRSPTPAQKSSDDEFDRESTAPSEASADAGDAERKFKLVLRAQGSKEIILTVRPSTSCGKVVRAFLAVVAERGGTVPTSPRKMAQVRLCVDGEKQSPDTPIADCDLEDGDMVEVVGMQCI